MILDAYLRNLNAMAVNKPIAFIIGAGQNIGAGVANALRSKGYRIALASRSAKNAGSNDDLHLATDLSKPETVSHAFASLRKQWGEPNVVLYNGRPNQHPHRDNVNQRLTEPHSCRSTLLWRR